MAREQLMDTPEIEGTACHAFASREELAEALADRVAAELDAARELRGQATLAVSGGTTPRRFFEALSKRDIGWKSVCITLVDERFVPPNNERSNARLVGENLLQARAKEASF